VTVNLTMTLERARQVRWQGAGPQGLMGELSDQGILRLKDLGWEIDNAYNPEARSAALTILAHRLGEATTLQTVARYGPQVIKGSKYLEEKEWDSLWKAVEHIFVAAVTITAISAILLSQLIERIARGVAWDLIVVSWVLAVVIIVIIATPFALRFKKRLDKEIANVKSYRAGQEGEVWVEDIVRANLDNRWTVFRNIKLPNEKQDIDFVLVSASGVWVLEVKAYKNEVRVVVESWERKEGQSWKPLDSNPTKQAAQNAAALHRFLEEDEEDSVSLWVTAVVVLTQPQPEGNFVGIAEDPKSVAIWRQEDVDSKLRELNEREAVLLEADRTRIVSKLRGIGERGSTREERDSSLRSE